MEDAPWLEINDLMKCDRYGKGDVDLIIIVRSLRCRGKALWFLSNKVNDCLETVKW